MGLIDIFKHVSSVLISPVNKSQQHQDNFLGNAKNWAQGCWVRGKYATSVLCSPCVNIFCSRGFGTLGCFWWIWSWNLAKIKTSASLSVKVSKQKGCQMNSRLGVQDPPYDHFAINSSYFIRVVECHVGVFELTWSWFSWNAIKAQEMMSWASRGCFWSWTY